MADHSRFVEQFSLLFPVFSGSVSTASLWRSRGAGKLSAPQRRGHYQGSPLAPRAHTRVGMTPSLHSSSESLDVGRWGLKPLSPCFTPPTPVIQPLFSSSSYHPHPFLSQVPRRALSARDWRRTGDLYALGGGGGLFQEAGARAGAGQQVDTRRPERAAGTAEGCSRRRGRRGLGCWRTEGRSVRRRERRALGPGTREAAAALARRFRCR